jgi:hypothetical protein
MTPTWKPEDEALVEQLVTVIELAQGGQAGWWQLLRTRQLANGCAGTLTRDAHDGDARLAHRAGAERKDGFARLPTVVEASTVVPGPAQR